MKQMLGLVRGALLLALFVSTGAVRAQTVTFDSVKIAELVVSSSWDQLESLFPPLFTAIEANLKAEGATEKASKVFGAELQKAMNREAMTKVYAQLIASKYSEAEQRETLLFFSSTAGQKYLALSKQAAQPEVFSPIVKQACLASQPQLGVFDRGSLNRLCPR